MTRKDSPRAFVKQSWLRTSVKGFPSASRVTPRFSLLVSVKLSLGRRPQLTFHAQERPSQATTERASRQLSSFSFSQQAEGQAEARRNIVITIVLRRAKFWRVNATTDYVQVHRVNERLRISEGLGRVRMGLCTLQNILTKE